MTFELSSLSIILIAMLVGAFVKGATGQGLPQIAIPVLASFLGVEHAVVVMSIPLVVANAMLLWTYRWHLRAARDLPAMLVTGIFGSVAGTVLLTTLDDRILSLALASVISLYVVMFLTHPDFSLRSSVTRYTSPPWDLPRASFRDRQGSPAHSSPPMCTRSGSTRRPTWYR